MDIKRAFSNIKEVFSHKKEWIIFLIASLIFYELNVIFSNFYNFKSLFNSLGFSETFYYLLNTSTGFLEILPLHSSILVIVLSLMTGILITIISYRNRIMYSEPKKKGFFGSLGIFLGILAPSCASCGIGLIALLGLSSGVASLPFQGQEISFFAILIIGFSILKISEKIGVCEVK